MIGKTLSGRYELQSKLGSGGMSTVYLAHDTNLDRPVAVKVMHNEISDQPDQLERFHREARTVARISHPNVVSVIDAGEDGGRPYIVFEYVEGETLKQRIDRFGQLPADEAAAYAIEIGRGLSAAHANRLVHRDVKPQNVLIDPEGRAKVTDFGIVRSLQDSEDGLTKAGRVLGTTDYVSPEQAMGEEVDPRSDVYSLGIVLYEMLTGRVPFEAETVVGVAMKHVNERPTDIRKLRPGISAMLAQTIDRALTKDPRRRYQDMGELLVDLEQAMTIEAAGAMTGSNTTVMDRIRTRPRPPVGRILGMAVVVLVLAAALVVAFIALNSGGGEQTVPNPGSLSAPASGTPIAIDAVGVFDPPPGDGAEADDLLPLTIDDDSATVWTGDHYSTDLFGGLKDGLGVYFRLDAPASPRAMHVASPEPGWNADIYAVTGEVPGELAGWGERIGTISDAPAEAAIQLTSLETHDVFMIWFTKLAASTDDTSRFRAEISEVKLTD